jgi:hypothetical protein
MAQTVSRRLVLVTPEVSEICGGQVTPGQVFF